MIKSQQALNELRVLVHSELDGTRMLDEYLKHCDILQKLVDKQSNPTLSECIKEWEDRDFEVVDNSINYLYVRNYNKNIKVLFRKFELSYKVEDFYDDEDSLVVSYELHNLIHKTLKALEVEECVK